MFTSCVSMANNNGGGYNWKELSHSTFLSSALHFGDFIKYQFFSLLLTQNIFLSELGQIRVCKQNTK